MIAKKEMRASTPPATAPALGLLETAGSSAMLDGRESVCTCTLYVCISISVYNTRNPIGFSGVSQT